MSCVSPDQINANPKEKEYCTENLTPCHFLLNSDTERKAQEMHCFVTSFQKCNLEYGATTGCFSSPKAEQCLESLLCGKKQNNKKPSKQTKNPNRKKLVKVLCMSEQWPEVVQVCSALGLAQG